MNNEEMHDYDAVTSMTAAEAQYRIRMEYTVKKGMITDVGKFESDPEYVPWFYQQVLEGFYCDTWMINGMVIDHVAIEDEDIEMWPELEGYTHIELWADTYGFINYNLLTKQGKVNADRINGMSGDSEE